MVAKSYQELEIVGEVFTASNRQYVNVKTKTGKLKTVRWYNEKEYAKMYPEEVAVARSADPQTKTAKDVLGFTNGYITIFKGDQEANNDWFRASIARYATWWGWYIISTDEVPTNLPAEISAVVLPWEIVGNENGKLKAEKEVREAVDQFLYSDSKSKHVGNVGDRIDAVLTITKNIPIDTQYGHSYIHTMTDDAGNVFSWTTAAKNWTVGSTHNVRGTIKEHKILKGERITILTRCMEV